MLTRRAFLVSLSSSALIFSAPAVVKYASLMKLRTVPPLAPRPHYGFVQRLFLHSRAPAIIELQEAGRSFSEIAAELERRGLSNVNRDPWTAQGLDGVVRLARELGVGRPRGAVVSRPFQMDPDFERNA